MSDLSKVLPIPEDGAKDETLAPLNASANQKGEIELVDSSRGQTENTSLIVENKTNRDSVKEVSP